MSPTFKFANEKPLGLQIEKRILLFAVLRDIAAGRNGVANDAYGDIKEALFMFSASFLHFTDLVFYNISRWDEFKEYKVRRPAKAHVGYAAPAMGARRSFNVTLRRLVRNQEVWAFTSGVRAISGLGQKSTPLPQLWSEENRDKPKDILAYSLRESGFARAKKLAEELNQILPWQLHEHIVRDRGFAEELTGRD